METIDHHGLQPCRPHVGRQTLECLGCSRLPPLADSAVIVFLREQAPALVPLALDVGFGRLALGMERIELLLEPPPRTVV